MATKVQMRVAAALFAGLMICGFARESAAQVIYMRQHDVLVDAIKNSHAEGVMQGATADLFSKQFRSSGLLMVRAVVLSSYPRHGCKRLALVYTKKDVIGDHGSEDVTLELKLNYCLDGRPPVDLERAE